MNILNTLSDKVSEELQNRASELRIDNIILGKTLYTVKGSEHVFTDLNFCLVLFENAYGFSYFQDDIDYEVVSRYVNRSALEIINAEIPIYARVAILDGLFCLLNKDTLKDPSLLKGTLREKATQRAVELLKPIDNGSKILLLGAVSEIIEEAQSKNCPIRVLDLEKQKIGLTLHSTNIESGTPGNMEQEIRDADFIVATGMIFVSETADELFTLTKKYGKKLILYMETGSNFGPQLIEHGAYAVLAEFFPYYDFYGDTKYKVLSSKEDE